MFQPDANQWPMGFFHTVLPPHFTGGVAPSRHVVALAAYLEKQAAHRGGAPGPEDHNASSEPPVSGGPLSGRRRLAPAAWALQDQPLTSGVK
jgi:hypothetical protein